MSALFPALPAPARFTRSGPALLLPLAGVIVLLVVAILTAGSGGAQPPATGAAALVPGDALLYVHLSIDPKRPAVEQALQIAARFPDYPLLREGLLARLQAIAAGAGPPAGPVDFARDVRPWLGHEAALALLNTTSATAGSLVILDVADRGAARRFLARAGQAGAATYRSTAIVRLATGTEMAFLGHFLAIGQDASVRAAIDTARGHVSSLRASSAYQRAVAGQPAGRVIDAYASLDGVRRLLAPQGALAGALGALVYQPSLDGVSIAFSPAPGGVAVRVHSALDPRLAKLNGAGRGAFSPSLIAALPAGTTLLLDLARLDQVAPRLLRAGAAGGVAGGVAPLLGRLGGALSAQGIDVQRDVLSIFHGETVVAIGPGAGGPPAPGSSASASRPGLVIVARTPDEGRSRTALAALEGPLAQLFPPPGSGPGQAPVFNDRDVGGITAHQLVLAAGLELDYAVFDGKVVVSTSLAGIAGVRNHARSLLEDPSYRATLANHPRRLTSLLFLDFSQLLRLGEQTGLTRSARYRSLRPDLEKVRAVGLTSAGGEADSTAELFVQIP